MPLRWTQKVTTGPAELPDLTSHYYLSFIRTVAPDPSRSLEYYKKACDEGNIAEACHRYSAFFIKGMNNVCDKNMQEAFAYSLKGNFSLQQTSKWVLICVYHHCFSLRARKSGRMCECESHVRQGGRGREEPGGGQGRVE